jgi:hypothetical protein
LIGEVCFDGLVREYIPYDQQSRGFCFSTFLADYTPAQTLPYLSEIAHLDWVCDEMLKASSETASRELSFQFPIFKIWCLCQTNNTGSQDEVVNLNDGSENIRVTRCGFELSLEKIE